MEVPALKKSSKGWSKRPFVGEWALTLKKFLAKQQDEVPEGWLRSEECLKKMGLHSACSGQRNQLLNRMVQENFLLKRNFRIFDGSGRRISSIVHYKLKEN